MGQNQNPNFRKLWGVPKEYIKKEGLSYIARASGLGKPLQMDKVTEKNTIFAFAKVKKYFFKDLGNYLSNLITYLLRRRD